jgi:hypothetical protein
MRIVIIGSLAHLLMASTLKVVVARFVAAGTSVSAPAVADG